MPCLPCIIRSGNPAERGRFECERRRWEGSRGGFGRFIHGSICLSIVVVATHIQLVVVWLEDHDR